MKVSDEIRNWCEFEDGTECGGFVTKASFDKLLALADRVDSEMVELPKDADGEYIHIGDVMEWCDSGETLTVEGIGSDVLFFIDGENAEWTAARNKRHHHAPTVEERLSDEEVVRCRDCACFSVDDSDHDYRTGWWCKRWYTDMVEPDGFCAWGKRRESE